MEKRKLTDEQQKRLYNNLAICFAVMGLILELITLIVPWNYAGCVPNLWFRWNSMFHICSSKEQV